MEANILLSGLDFASAGLAAAHGVHNGLSVAPGHLKTFRPCGTTVPRCLGLPPVYNSLDMSSRCARLLAVVLLATFALDVGDADCAVGAWTSDAARTSLSQGRTIGTDAAGGCACCLGAEAACPVTLVWMGEVPDSVVTPASAHVRAGVLRILYRPPLRLS